MRFIRSLLPLAGNCSHGHRCYVPDRCTHFSTRSSRNLPSDFHYIPDFFNISEQRVLLAASLEKLDSAGSRQFRRRRRSIQSSDASSGMEARGCHVQSMFMLDEYYEFEEGHYDGVIRRFREMHVTSWPKVEGLTSVLARLQELFPSRNTQTHLLHLATDGEILPHIDNVGASGSWILGVSLGSSRIMRLEGPAKEGTIYTIPLHSGSVYIQKDNTRYEYQHSILQGGSFDGVQYDGGQRLSIMIRDLPTTSP